MPMTKPRALRPGAHVRVVSPSSGLNPDQVELGVETLRDMGYVVSFGEHVFDRHYYLAGADADRAKDLQEAFADPTVDCVMCARGGYGAARILSMLDLDAMAASGKAFCGFSDITTFHLALNRRGLATFHTPMMITLSVPREPWVVESLARLLRGEDPFGVDYPRAQTLTPGQAEGEVTGGCLCLLADSLSTPDPLETEGKIFVIEDVDENPHRVDALFTHMRNAGLLQRAAGIVIGEMTRTDERSDPSIGSWPWREIVADRVADLGVPAVVGFPFGHMPNMLSVPLGVRARLDADAGTLTLLENPCAD